MCYVSKAGICLADKHARETVSDRISGVDMYGLWPGVSKQLVAWAIMDAGRAVLSQVRLG